MSHRTLIALFDDEASAESATSELRNSGILASDVESFGHGNYSGASSRTLLSRLSNIGVPERDSDIYAEGVRRGGTLVMAKVREADAERASTILNSGRGVDIDHRAEHYQQSGWTGFDENAAPYDTEAMSHDRQMRANAGEEIIPMSEEHLDVGKRSVARAGVRVRSYVVETPVEESVTLRDETVSVERRAASGDAMDADFQERTVEMDETDEEAVVAKRARRTEDVVIRKQVDERTETVRDTVRHTEVDIDKGSDKTLRP